MLNLLIKFGIAILPLFIIGHLLQNWAFVLGGIVEFAIIFALFYKRLLPKADSTR